MTQQKTWQERFDNLFNAIGYDHIDTCTCPPFSDKECYCISGRQQLKFLISQTQQYNVMETEDVLVIKRK